MAVTMSLHRNGHPLRLALVLLVGVVLLPAAAWVSEDDFMPVRAIRITGDATHVDVARLQTRLAAAVDGNFLFLDLARLGRAAEALPWVAGAEVRRIWPDTLEVVLRERVPVARWGEDALLDEHGEVFRPQSLPSLPALPRLEGPPGSAARVRVTWERLNEALADSGLRMATLAMNDRRAWHGTLDNGIRLQLGRGDPVERVRRFAAVYPRILAPRADEIERIDLRYPNGLAVRWREDTTDIQ